MRVQQLDHINFSVQDLDASLDWYTRVFDFVTVERGLSDGIPFAIQRSGEALLCMYEHPELEFVDRHERARRGLHGVSHFSFRITDREEWELRATREGVEFHYGGAVERPHSLAWYLNDPTGYEIEVALWEGDEIRFS